MDLGISSGVVFLGTGNLSFDAGPGDALSALRQIALSPKPDVNVTAESLNEGIEELNGLNIEEERLVGGTAYRNLEWGELTKLA